MRDPIRMVESGELSSIESELLDSARHEQPDERVRGILLAGLGSASIVPLTQLSTPPAPFLAAPTWSKLGLLRWVSGVGLGGALTVGWLATRPAPGGASPCADGKCGAVTEAPAVTDELAAPEERPRAVANPRESGEAGLPEARGATSATPDEPSTESGATEAGRLGARGSVSPARRVSESGASGSLTEEVVALEPARVALGAGDAAQALRILSRYQTRFPKGVLRPEADALKAQARSLAGTKASRGQSESEASPASALKPR